MSNLAAVQKDVVAHQEMMNALVDYWPGAQWTLNGSDYSGLVWLDEKTPKPTEKELAAAMAIPKQPELAAENKVLFEHENRLRSLEGKPPLTLQQFTASMVTPAAPPPAKKKGR
jgi:hypothetical protein